MLVILSPQLPTCTDLYGVGSGSVPSDPPHPSHAHGDEFGGEKMILQITGQESLWIPVSTLTLGRPKSAFRLVSTWFQCYCYSTHLFIKGNSLV